MTERRRAGKRRIGFERERMFFRSAPQASTSIFVFWNGGEGESIGIERQRKQVRMSGPGELRL